MRRTTKPKALAAADATSANLTLTVTTDARPANEESA